MLTINKQSINLNLNQMRKQTNNQNHIDYLKFITFLSEGLPYIECWTPTKVNSGGCGVFAKLLTDELDKMGISYKIWGLFYTPTDVENYKSNFVKFIESGKTSYHPQVNHIIIQIDSLFVDSDGICNASVLTVAAKVEMTKERLSTLVDYIDTWNPIFDRDCIPDMKKRMDDLFDNYSTFKEGSLKYPKLKKDVPLTEKTKAAIKAQMRDPLFPFIS